MAEVTSKQQWNFAAAAATIAIVATNVVAGWAVYAGKLPIQDYLASVGPLNAVVLGWVGRLLMGPAVINVQSKIPD